MMDAATKRAAAGFVGVDTFSKPVPRDLSVVIAYLRALPSPKMLLWCYLLWYAYFAARHFEPTPTLWLTSVGLSLLIGTGLYVSTAYSARERVHVSAWATFRFYLMPFCVSSFSALLKGRGFTLLFSPDLGDNLRALGLCAAFVILVESVKALPSVAERRVTATR